MLFGIDYARQAIWQRRQKEVAEARAEGQEEGIEVGREEGIEVGREEGIEVGREEGIEVGREEGYRLGFDAGVSEERRRRNGANDHNWMFGGPDDDR